MKKILLILSVFFLSFGLAPHVFAACSDYSQFKSIPGKTSGCAQMLGSGWTIVDNACLPNSSLKDTVCGLPVNMAVPTVPAQPQAQPSATPTGNNNAPQGFTALAPIPGLTDTNGAVVNSKSLTDFFNNLYKYLIGIAAILAVIQIIRAGFNIAINKESVSVLMDSKGKISQAILGLILVLSPVLVFSIINPSILNLSLNLPALNKAPEVLVQTGIISTDSATGCTVTGVASILQIVTCPTIAAATTWSQNCSDGLLSEIVPLTKNTDGTPATSQVSCARAGVFEFIQTSASSDSIQPLAVASNSRINGTDTLYQSNGSDAVQFANICHSVGWSTCGNTKTNLLNKMFGGALHDCSPLPKTALSAEAPSPAQCYTKEFYCEDISWTGRLKERVMDTSTRCYSNPNWTPFQ